MQLAYIKTDRCPVCGCAIVVSESVETEINSDKIRVHSNGYRWEYRRFACGYETHFSPNFVKEYAKKECSLDPKKLERETKRSEAKNALYVAIKKLDVDEEYKSRLWNAIIYI